MNTISNLVSARQDTGHMFLKYSHSVYSNGAMDFWNLNDYWLEYNSRYGKNTLESNHERKVVGVTFDDAETPLPAVRKKNISQKFSDSTLAQSFYYGKMVSDGIMNVLLGLLVGCVFGIVSFFLGFPFLLGAVTAITTCILGYFSILLWEGHSHYKDSGVYKDSHNFAGQPKLGRFPVSRRFQVILVSTSENIKRILRLTNNDYLMLQRVRTKIETDRDYLSVDKWAAAVVEIVGLDRDFPVDAIPLLTEDAKKVRSALRIRLGLLDPPEDEVLAVTDGKGSAKGSAPLLLETERLRVEQVMAREDSGAAVFHAFAYIENM